MCNQVVITMGRRFSTFQSWWHTDTKDVVYTVLWFIVGLLISDWFLADWVAYLFEATGDKREGVTTGSIKPTETGENLLDVAVAFFTALCSFSYRRLRDLHGPRFTTLSDAVGTFLSLVDGPQPSSYYQYGPLYERLRQYIDQFASQNHLLVSFSKVSLQEQSRIFRLLSRAFHGFEDADGYHDQIRIASILCAQGRCRFWATSTDPAMIFHRENAFYYHALQNAAEDYHRGNRSDPPSRAENPPYLCRIFISSPETLDYSLELYDSDFLEMYRKHILWADQENLEPIKFLFGTPQDFITAAGGKADDLGDFMIVDDRFVYGRQGIYATRPIKITAFDDPSKISHYDRMFRKLYQQAKSVYDVLDEKIAACGEGTDRQKDLKDLKELCAYIKQKARNKDLYRSRFERTEEHGVQFFEKVCKLIADSRGDVIAVDVADRKVSHFYRAWLNHSSYQKFRNAGRKAVNNGKAVIRLFILKTKPDSSAELFVTEFLREFLSDGVTIGFLYENDVKTKIFPNEHYRLEYEMDFLLCGIPRAYASTLTSAFTRANEEAFKAAAREQGAFGFELFGKEPFVEEMLEWERNLIDMGGMCRKVEAFAKLWSNTPDEYKSAVEDRGNRDSVDAEAARIWTRLSSG